MNTTLAIWGAETLEEGMEGFFVRDLRGPEITFPVSEDQAVTMILEAQRMGDHVTKEGREFLAAFGHGEGVAK
jgi:hypothetical protein